jgi:hypothetical protein
VLGHVCQTYVIDSQYHSFTIPGRREVVVADKREIIKKAGDGCFIIVMAVEVLQAMRGTLVRESTSSAARKGASRGSPCGKPLSCRK